MCLLWSWRNSLGNKTLGSRCFYGKRSLTLPACRRREQNNFERTSHGMKGKAVGQKEAGDREGVWENPDTAGANARGGEGSDHSTVSAPLKVRKHRLGLMDSSAPD